MDEWINEERKEGKRMDGRKDGRLRMKGRKEELKINKRMI